MKDEWVKAAMTDDSMVAELLVRLKQTTACLPAPKSAAVALKWGVRLPRSRTNPMRYYEVTVNKKDVDSNISSRASPTTPLSWSGGGGAASPSNVTDGFEETSRHVIFSTAPRSKGIFGSEAISTSSKRLKRKKTFVELKEEESLLLKERTHLKKEIATLRATYKEQSVRNESLKRMKLDLSLDAARNSSSAANDLSRPHQRISPSVDGISVASQTCAPQDDAPLSNSYNDVADSSKLESCGILPDLNMLPEDESCVAFYGSS